MILAQGQACRRVFAGIVMAGWVVPTDAAQSRPTDDSSRAVPSVHSFSVLSGYDGNRSGDRDPSASPIEGVYSGLVLDTKWRQRVPRVALTLAGSGGLRVYPGSGDVAVDSSGAAGLTARLGRRTQHVSQTVRYSPGTLADLGSAYAADISDGFLPASHVSTDPRASVSQVTNDFLPSSDFSSDPRARVSHGTALELKRVLTSRSSATLAYRFHRTHAEGDRDSGVQSVSFEYTSRWSRDMTLHTGYAYHAGTYGLSGGDQPLHDIDLALEYSRGLALSRFTTLSFASGPSLVATAGRIDARAAGRAALVQRIGGDWEATLGYDRDLTFVEGLNEPLFAHWLRTSLSGRTGRRTDFRLTAFYETGRGGGGQDNAVFESYRANAVVRVAVTRRVRAYVEYTRYGDRSGDVAQPWPGRAGHVTQQRVQTGLMLSSARGQEVANAPRPKVRAR